MYQKVRIFTQKMPVLRMLPYFTQSELRKTLEKHDIKLMSWYPLGHGETAAQICLRWHVDMGFIVIPGSKKEGVVVNRDRHYGLST